jgi:hypothetical protein
VSARTFVIASMILAAAACTPTFEPKGTLWIERAPFHPIACHVLTCGTGIELRDAGRNRLEIRIPPQTLNAWQTIGGSATARWIAGSNGNTVELGSCASLTLRGEGYHGSGRRAASGRVSLSCSGAVTAGGALDFSGCF